MRKNIIKLINSGITAHRVSNETELPRNTAYRIFSGEAKLDNVSLRNAEILNEFYLKNKEEIGMKNIINEIRENYKVDGENERYATLFNSNEETLDEMNVDTFEEKYNVSVDEISYPIITFDNANATDGIVFTVKDDQEEILSEASEYFERK